MKMKCTNVELLNEDMVKNPCLRLTYVEDGLGIAAAQNAASVRLIISGNVFDDNNKPKKADNLAWCKSVMGMLKGSIENINSFEVPCEPIVRKDNNGKYITGEEGKVRKYNTFTMWQFSKLNEDTGEYEPVGGMERLKRRADNMIRNSSRVELLSVLLARKQKKAEEERLRKEAEDTAKQAAGTISPDILAGATDDTDLI